MSISLAGAVRLVRRRPAETATLALGAAGWLLASALGADGDQAQAIILIVAAVPTLVTRLVTWLRTRRP